MIDTPGHDNSGTNPREGPGPGRFRDKKGRKLQGLGDHPNQAQALKGALKGPKKGGDLGPKM